MGTNTDEKYLANDVTPVFSVHPGSILGEELKARGISQKSFAETVGLQATHLSALIHGTRTFTPSVAKKIASGLEGISADFWIKSQKRYNIRQKRALTSQLVSGYNTYSDSLQPAFLAQPQSSYNGNLQVTITIPEADKELLVKLVERLGWQYSA